jgi:hypothetical protein
MNAPALPKARMNVDEFLAWSKRQPNDRYELVDGALNPPGLTVAVAALLGPFGGAEVRP